MRDGGFSRRFGEDLTLPGATLGPVAASIRSRENFDVNDKVNYTYHVKERNLKLLIWGNEDHIHGGGI